MVWKNLSVMAALETWGMPRGDEVVTQLVERRVQERSLEFQMCNPTLWIDGRRQTVTYWLGKMFCYIALHYVPSSGRRYDGWAFGRLCKQQHTWSTSRSAACNKKRGQDTIGTFGWKTKNRNNRNIRVKVIYRQNLRQILLFIPQ